MSFLKDFVGGFIGGLTGQTTWQCEKCGSFRYQKDKPSSKGCAEAGWFSGHKWFRVN